MASPKRRPTCWPSPGNGWRKRRERNQRRYLAEALPVVRFGPADRRRHIPARDRDRLHRTGARRRLAPGRRPGGDCRGHRRRLRATPAEEALGGAGQGLKRFWKDAEVIEDGGFGIALDGRRVKTPARAKLVVPTRDLAEAIATEWRECGEIVDPRAMPLTGLANAAIDRVAPDPEAFASLLSKYGETDLLCYRAESPPELIRRQQESWDPLLAWARRRYDVDFRTVASTIWQPQPQATTQRLAHAVAALDPYRLAGLSPLVTIGGSLVAGLAVLEGAIQADEAWQAVSLDERWQLEKWGSDTAAEAALEARAHEFLTAARLLEVLG